MEKLRYVFDKVKKELFPCYWCHQGKLCITIHPKPIYIYASSYLTIEILIKSYTFEEFVNDTQNRKVI